MKQTKNWFVVVHEWKGRSRATVRSVGGSMDILLALRDCGSAYLCSSKKEARVTAKEWNEGFEKEGRAL